MLLLEIPWGWTQPPPALVNVAGCVHNMAQIQSPGARRVSSQKVIPQSAVHEATCRRPTACGVCGFGGFSVSAVPEYLLTLAEGSLIQCDGEITSLLGFLLQVTLEHLEVNCC